MSRPEDLTRVLFLDYENAVRSQMAEAFLRRLGEGRYAVFSGGMVAQELHPLTVEVMGEIGYDLTGQTGKCAQVFFGQSAFQCAILVCRAEEKRCPRLFPGALKIERWPSDDPLAGDAPGLGARFRAARDRVLVQTQAWVKAQKDAETGVFTRKLMMTAAH